MRRDFLVFFCLRLIIHSAGLEKKIIFETLCRHEQERKRKTTTKKKKSLKTTYSFVFDVDLGWATRAWLFFSFWPLFPVLYRRISTFHRLPNVHFVSKQKNKSKTIWNLWKIITMPSKLNSFVETIDHFRLAAAAAAVAVASRATTTIFSTIDFIICTRENRH